MFNKIDYTEKLIKDTYGDVVSVGSKLKTLRKFGRNNDLDTGIEEQIWNVGGLEVLSTTNDITHIASSNAGDTQQVIVEGHTIDGNGDFTFVVQSVTLAGQTKTALPTPLARATRLYNNGSTDFLGTVNVARDVTFTAGVPASDISVQAIGADNQSAKTATTISKSDYWVIEQLAFGIRGSGANNVDFKLQIREKGKVFRTLYPASVRGSASNIVIPLEIPLIVRPNSDFRVMGTSTGTNVVADAIVSGYLASVL